jgi:AGZA family xanthine/uracil permease-like MFS transporter
MVEWIRAFFDLDRQGTSVRRETLAGTTTFLTMAYIVVVNPAILRAAGIPTGAAMVATILTAVAGTLLMGLYARRPFAVAPYMGENAFVAYVVVKGLGLSWQSALGAVFMSGVAFVILTLLRLRQWMVEGVPPGLRHSFPVGIGLFLAFVGLNESGLVVLGTAGAPVAIGDIGSPPVLLAVGNFLLMAALMIRRVPGAILIAILVTSVAAFLLGLQRPPAAWVSLPPSLAPTFLQLELADSLSLGKLAVAFTIFVMAFVDTMGTLIGVSARAGLLDADGNLAQIERPMLVDAVATTLAGLLGTTASGAFIESATGIEAGGRTGLTAVVTALLFLSTLFFSPFVAAIPAQAFGPALILVGLLMLRPVTRIDFDDLTELIPAFGVVALMSFTFNIAIGMMAGFLLYPLCKLVRGRWREIRPGLWALAAFSLAFFLFYPYR